MKKYTIISTYPKNGTKNIGDNLISESTIEAIKKLKGEDVSISKIWRADSWENCKETVLTSDAVIFACLAMRENMDKVEYPYLEDIINSGVPYGAIASGTHLPVTDENLFDKISNKSLSLLRKMGNDSLFFTTRGALSQSFCNYNQIKANFSGDIAFFDKRYNEKVFEPGTKINRIAVSDPHYPNYFLPSFKRLISELKCKFKAEITVLLHGINPEVEEYCKIIKIPFVKIYENIHNGLDIYDEFDMHVGYRVHAHVSTLKRRKYSYLLEQDGRGNDYGLTLNRKISVNSFLPDGGSLTNKIKNKINNKFLGSRVNTVAVDYLLSLIVHDYENNFEKFIGLEKQINRFNKECLNSLEKLP